MAAVVKFFDGDEEVASLGADAALFIGFRRKPDGSVSVQTMTFRLPQKLVEEFQELVEAVCDELEKGKDESKVGGTDGD